MITLSCRRHQWKRERATHRLGKKKVTFIRPGAQLISGWNSWNLGIGIPWESHRFQYLVLLTGGNPGATTPVHAAKPLNCWYHVECMFLLNKLQSSVTPFARLLVWPKWWVGTTGIIVVVVGYIEVDVDIGCSVDPWGRLVLDQDKTPSVGICQNSASMVIMWKQCCPHHHHMHSLYTQTHIKWKVWLLSFGKFSWDECSQMVLTSLLNQQWRKISNWPKPI